MHQVASQSAKTDDDQHILLPSGEENVGLWFLQRSSCIIIDMSEFRITDNREGGSRNFGGK